jgi:hypothetical protein
MPSPYLYKKAILKKLLATNKKSGRNTCAEDA